MIAWRVFTSVFRNRDLRRIEVDWLAAAGAMYQLIDRRLGEIEEVGVRVPQ